MTILTILSLLTIAIYTVVMVCRNGIPYSVSDTYYSLEHKWAFSVAVILSALLLMPSAFQESTESSEFLVFLFTTGQCLVGTAPHFKGWQHKLHLAGAVLLLVCSQIWIGLNHPAILVTWESYLIFTLIAVFRSDRGFFPAFLDTKPLFWVEIVSFVNLYLSVLI